MTDLVTIKKHARLFDRMGKAVGLDLQEEAIEGNLQFDEIAEAVLRCTRCSEPGACQRWLNKFDVDGDLQGPTKDARTKATPPEYCRNSDLFSYLQQASE